MKEYIKQIMDTPGWEELKEILDDLINNLRNEDLDPSMTASEYKINDLANKKAIKLIQSFFIEVKRASKPTLDKKGIKIYK